MPYHIEKRDGKFCVITTETGKVKTCYGTKNEALKLQRALMINVKEAKEPDNYLEEALALEFGGPGSGRHPEGGNHDRNMADMNAGHTLVHHVQWGGPGGKATYSIKSPSGDTRQISSQEHTQLYNALRGKLSLVHEVNAPGVASVSHYQILPKFRQA